MIRRGEQPEQSEQPEEYAGRGLSTSSGNSGGGGGGDVSSMVLHHSTFDAAGSLLSGSSSSFSSSRSEALVSLTMPNLAMVPLANQRTSRLKEANYLLSGHTDKVFSVAFDPSGQTLASGSMDSHIFLWDVYGGFHNYNVLKGHKSAILEVKWLSGDTIASASADKTVKLWDANKGEKIRNYTGHSAVVNCLCTCSGTKGSSPTVFASGSDDRTAALWDTRSKRPVMTLYHDYQVTSICMSSDGAHVYTGGIDNIIRRFDIRGDVSAADMELLGHRDTITGLALSPDETHLLSNSMDCSLDLWDVRPFVPSSRDGRDGRRVRQFIGATHGAEKVLLRCSFSSDGRFVAAGSADRNAYVWAAETGVMVYCLPGHKGSVNDVTFHPQEPILASASTDKTIFAGELSK